MADRTRFVNTASATPGGTGITNATTGVDRAYQTLMAAELAERRDLTTLAGRMIFNCTGTAADTGGAVTFATANWPNPTSAFYILIQANPGQEAVMPYSTTRYRLEPTTGSPFSCDVGFTRLFAIQAKLAAADTGTAAFFLDVNAGGGTMYAERCFAHVNGVSGGNGFNLAGVDATATTNLGNCVAYDNSGVATCLGFQAAGGTNNPYNISNCTAYGFTASGTGFVSGGALTVFKNCLAANNNIGYSGAVAAGSKNNASSLADAPGTSNRNTQTFTFINAATGDLHITAGDAGAKGFGADLSADAAYPFTVDFDGLTRSAPWDIGATKAPGAAAGYPAAAFFGIPNRMPQPSVRAY